jgi:DNA-directed RNA polymerase specialized sigma subunit
MAKYDSARKTARDKMLYSLHLQYPDMSQAEIGKQFGIKRSRVSQIIGRFKREYQPGVTGKG